MKNKTSNTAATNAAAPTDLGHSPDALAQRKAELLALLAQTAPELISDNQLNLDKLKDLDLKLDLTRFHGRYELLY